VLAQQSKMYFKNLVIHPIKVNKDGFDDLCHIHLYTYTPIHLYTY
jgi:hypothetical protein